MSYKGHAGLNHVYFSVISRGVQGKPTRWGISSDPAWSEVNLTQDLEDLLKTNTFLYPLFLGNDHFP